MTGSPDSPPPVSLFRDAAIRAKHQAGLGAIQLRTPVSTGMLLLATIAATLALLVFFMTARYTRHTIMEGLVVAVDRNPVRVTDGLKDRSPPEPTVPDGPMVEVAFTARRSEASALVSGQSLQLVLMGGRASDTLASQVVTVSISPDSALSHNAARAQVTVIALLSASHSQRLPEPGDRLQGTFIHSPERVFKWVRRDQSSDSAR